MARVIAVVGAGGKSTLIERLAGAEKYSAAASLRVCVTTTTHIYRPQRENSAVTYRGKDSGEKLSYPGDEEFRRLCEDFDIILVEADGSKHCPVKIPAPYEPVIPDNADEIFVVMGLHAVGRPIGEVCQRFFSADKAPLLKAFPNIAAQTLITTDIIDEIARSYYINPLRKKFPKAAIHYLRNNFVDAESLAGSRVALILLASGTSARFGNDNKLLQFLNGKELFRYGLDSLSSAEELLRSDGIKAEVFITGGNVDSCIDAKLIANPDRLEGIAASIRHGTKAALAYNCDAVLFLAGDMPNFPANDVARLVREFLCSGKVYGCAFSDHPANPGIFRASAFTELLKLSGDSGALRLIKQHPAQTHYYVVAREKLLDVDTLSDIRDLQLRHVSVDARL